MILLVDGSNLLGRGGLDRQDTEARRALVRHVVAYARQHSAKATVFFDGLRPAAFATSLGAVQVVFSGPRPADDLIAERASSAREPVAVVTSDQALGRRVSGRRVEVIDARRFLRLLERDPDSPGKGEDDVDWESYFSDGENRNV